MRKVLEVNKNVIIQYFHVGFRLGQKVVVLNTTKPMKAEKIETHVKMFSFRDKRARHPRDSISICVWICPFRLFHARIVKKSIALLFSHLPKQ